MTHTLEERINVVLLLLCLSRLLYMSIFTESAQWADSVIESRCPYICTYVPSQWNLFPGLFAPIYKGPRSIFFGVVDSLGKSYGKVVVSDLAILARKWSKIAAQKKFILGSFLTITLHFTFYRSDRGGSVSSVSSSSPAVAVCPLWRRPFLSLERSSSHPPR